MGAFVWVVIAALGATCTFLSLPVIHMQTSWAHFSSSAMPCTFCTPTVTPSIHAISQPSTRRKVEVQATTPQPENFVEIALHRSSNGLLLADALVSSLETNNGTENKNASMMFVLRTADENINLRTEIFCESKYFCGEDTNCTKAISSPAQKLAVLNDCRRSVGALPCNLNQNEIPSECLHAKLQITIGGSSSFLLTNATVSFSLIHDPALTPTAPYDVFYAGAINLGLVNFDSLQEQANPNPWRQMVISKFSGLVQVVQTDDNFVLRAGRAGILFKTPNPIWSFNSAVPQPVRPVIPIFHLSICEVDLFANYSSHWPAVFSLQNPCFVVPEYFYRMIMTWLPAECPDETLLTACQNPTNDIQDRQCKLECPLQDTTNADEGSDCWRCCHRCWLTRSVDVNSLPPLTFKLSESGPQIVLPLRSLLLANNELCLESRGGSKGYFDQSLQRIVFGNMAATGVGGVMLDYSSVRLGFEQTAHENKSTCPQRKTCVGAQTYYGPMNTCLDPPCSRYYFQQVNSETHQCELILTFKFVVLLILGLLALAEFVLLERRLRVTNEAADAIPSLWSN